MEHSISTKKIPDSYRAKILERLRKTVTALASRKDPTWKGRGVPDEDTLLLGEGVHLNLAVLFLDICSFTSWPSATSSEQTAILTVFNLFMPEMVRISSDYGGAVEKHTGDGLMAYFENTPNDNTQTASHKALAAAMTMFDVSSNLINPYLKSQGYKEVEFRIGIDYGPVTIANVGTANRWAQHVAIGTTANIANRILKVAGKNEIVIGDMVHKQLDLEFKLHCELFKTDTGFIYMDKQLPYSYYRFIGRWLEGERYGK